MRCAVPDFKTSPSVSKQSTCFAISSVYVAFYKNNRRKFSGTCLPVLATYSVQHEIVSISSSHECFAFVLPCSQMRPIQMPPAFLSIYCASIKFSLHFQIIYNAKNWHYYKVNCIDAKWKFGIRYGRSARNNYTQTGIAVTYQKHVCCVYFIIRILFRQTVTGFQ